GRSKAGGHPTRRLAAPAGNPSGRRSAGGNPAWDSAHVYGRAEQDGRGRPSRGGSQRHYSPGLSGEQLGGGHQQRLAHAPSRPSAEYAGFVGPQTPVLELPPIQQWPPPQNHALRAPGPLPTRRISLVGPAQTNT